MVCATKSFQEEKGTRQGTCNTMPVALQDNLVDTMISGSADYRRNLICDFTLDSDQQHETYAQH